MKKQQMIKKAVLGALIISALSVETVFAATVDLNLEKAINMALNNNSTVKISSAELAAAKAQQDQAEGARWGSITASHQSARSDVYRSNGSVVTSAAQRVNNDFTNKVAITVPIYTGGQIEGTIKKAKKNYEYYQYGMDSAYQTTKYDATKGYYDVLQASNTVTLSRETVDRLAEHLKNTQAQFDVGVVAKADVLRSEVELADAQQTLTKANNAYDVAVANLDNVVGLSHDTKLNLSEGLEYKGYKNDLENCMTYAMANRPEIHQAAAAVEMAKAAKQVANAGNLPQVGLSGSNAWNKDTFPGTDRENWALGVSVSMNVWDYGVTAAKVAEAKANIVKAQETYRQTVDAVQLAVRSDYLGLREAEKRISTSSVAVSQAEEDYRIAVIRYQAGVGTNTDVIDASVALTNAKNNYIQALYDYNTYRALLEQAMGVPVSKE
jgi:outer membrane protein